MTSRYFHENDNNNTWDGDIFVYRGGKVHRTNKKKIKHVIVSGSVLKIDDQAFELCPHLETVEFSSSTSTSTSSSSSSPSLKEIGNRAFFRCSSLRSIILPPTVARIGKRAFSCCSNLSSPIFGPFLSPSSSSSTSSSLRIIEKCAFYDCISLTSIEFPSTLERLDGHAFACCSNLTTVKFSKSSTKIKQIPRGCFSSCENLNMVILPDFNDENIDTSDNNDIHKRSRKKGRDGLQILSSQCFAGCSDLSSIHLPNSLKVIGRWAFSYCESLTAITIPSSVQHIGFGAFIYCASAKSVYFPPDSKLQTIHSFTFFYCSSLESITLPSSLQKINSDAFYECSNLTKVDYVHQPKLPGLATLEDNENEKVSAHHHQDNGTTPTFRLPNSIRYVASDAFSHCKKLNNDLIDWKRIYYVCDVNRTKQFLQKSYTCPLSLRPYVLLSPEQRRQLRQRRQQEKEDDNQTKKKEQKRTKNNELSKNKESLSKEEQIIRHSSSVYYILIRDNTMWEQQHQHQHQQTNQI